MPRLIDADAVCKRLAGYERDCAGVGDVVAAGVFADAIDEILDSPTIDPKDMQPRGHWIEHPTGGLVCSHCDRYKPDEWRSMCCPNCGARMMEEM